MEDSESYRGRGGQRDDRGVRAGRSRVEEQKRTEHSEESGEDNRHEDEEMEEDDDEEAVNYTSGSEDGELVVREDQVRRVFT